MGLIKLGSASEECAKEMLVYAHETQHEKIIRGLAIGVAFIYYGKQEQSDGLVATLLAEKVHVSSSDCWKVVLMTHIGSYPSLRRSLYPCLSLRWHIKQ